MSADPTTPELDLYNLKIKWFSAAVVLAQCAIPLTVLIHPAFLVIAMLLKSIVMVGYSMRLDASMPRG